VEKKQKYKGKSVAINIGSNKNPLKNHPNSKVKTTPKGFTSKKLMQLYTKVRTQSEEPSGQEQNSQRIPPHQYQPPHTPQTRWQQHNPADSRFQPSHNRRHSQTAASQQEAKTAQQEEINASSDEPNQQKNQQHYNT
jgi:hypothetical protein